MSDKLWNARVVYDKFHAIQHVVEACDQVSMAVRRAEAGYRDLLERTRWMWLKNRVNRTEKEAQKWESLPLKRCVTGMAYEMGLELQGIYERKDAGQGMKRFRNCARGCRRCGSNRRTARVDARAARMVEGHLEGILAHRIRGLMTAFMEGLNSLL